jgi:alcohol dehydrogenase (NADP+)
MPHVPQVLLRWNVQRGVAVLPKASSQSHMVDNIQGLWEWQLTYEQKVRRVHRAQKQVTMFTGDLHANTSVPLLQARLDALDQGKRFVNPEWHDFED